MNNNTVLVLSLIIFSGILIVNGFEFDQRLFLGENDSNNNNGDNDEDVTTTTTMVYKLHNLHKLRRRRDTPIHMCGPVLAKRVAEACNKCSKNPNTSSIRRRRNVDILGAKIRVKRDGIADRCCKGSGCTMDDLRSYCC